MVLSVCWHFLGTRLQRDSRYLPRCFPRRESLRRTRRLCSTRGGCSPWQSPGQCVTGLSGSGWPARKSHKLRPLFLRLDLPVPAPSPPPLLNHLPCISHLPFKLFLTACKNQTIIVKTKSHHVSHAFMAQNCTKCVGILSPLILRIVLQRVKICQHRWWSKR